MHRSRLLLVVYTKFGFRTELKNTITIVINNNYVKI